MKTWHEIYVEEIASEDGTKNYIDRKIKSKKPLINMIKEKTSRKGKILEAGCGTGIISTYLANEGYDVTGIDIDEKILEMAQNISEQYANEKCAKFQNQSIFKLNYPKWYYDVSFSSGVLEHFEDGEIIMAINKQLEIAKTVIISIPTSYFEKEEALHGDERFMDISHWRELIYKSDGKILKECKCHFLKFPYHYLNCKKIFKPWPYRIFMITKNS